MLLLAFNACCHGHEIELAGEVRQRIEDGLVALLEPIA
jgi:hypothetical protein